MLLDLVKMKVDVSGHVLVVFEISLLPTGEHWLHYFDTALEINSFLLNSKIQCINNKQCARKINRPIQNCLHYYL
jgi:hypothetical protein